MDTTARAFVIDAGNSLSEYETVLEGARRLALLEVDELPIRDDAGRIVGVLSQRDVVSVVAERRDPDAVRVGRFAWSALSA